MSHDYIQTAVQVYPESGAALTTNLIDFNAATGVIAVMNFGRPIEVLKMGITMDNGTTVTLGSFSIKLQKYLKPGDNTNAVDLGTITPAAGLAKGDVVFNKFQGTSGTSSTGSDGSTVTTAPRVQTTDLDTSNQNKFKVLAGEQLVWNETVVMTSGKGQVWVEYVERPLSAFDQAMKGNLKEVSA
jgi:hypothetical protein